MKRGGCCEGSAVYVFVGQFWCLLFSNLRTDLVNAFGCKCPNAYECFSFYLIV